MNDYTTYNIETWRLICFSVVLLIPVCINLYLDTKLLKNMFISSLRMVLQLTFIGFYLAFLFKVNSMILNYLWILIMIGVANSSILSNVGIKKLQFFLINYFALGLTIFIVELLFLIVFDFDVLVNARYLVPLLGMVLGNILRCNIVGVERFFAEIKNRKDEYILYISLGANQNEAIKPFWNSAYIAAIKPQLAALATIGLVSLPGMMTGQVLGGSPPIEAVKYQILIMIAIFSSASLSVFCSLYYFSKKSFDKFGRINEDIFS